ncbi:MAG: OmpA family protein [Acidobacteriota bacterium]|jgi:outer membrane protein OmpA-like peptidoglycan-associated protein
MDRARRQNGDPFRATVGGARARWTHWTRAAAALAGLALIAALAGACAGATAPYRGPYETRREKTAKGAGIGAAAGAAAAILKGEREADEILAGAAIGAVVGAGVGAYMDAQEEKLARIPGTSVERVSPDTLLVHFESDVLFDVDSALLEPSSRGTLDRVVQVLLEHPKTAIVVQGHTDATGSEEHNQALSERRAGAVKNYLIGRGADPGRITAVGYGEGFPVASNETESGRRLNRRVDLLLKAKAR